MIPARSCNLHPVSEAAHALSVHSHCYPLSSGMPRWLEHGTTLHSLQLYSAEVLLSTASGGTAMRNGALSVLRARQLIVEQINCLT